MRYLIIHDYIVFSTNYFEADNNFIDGMMVVDLINAKYMRTMGLWLEIPEDHL